MTGTPKRRLWTMAAVEPAGSAFAVTLDGRPLRTPGKQRLALPTRPLAEAVAAEWRDQADTVRPETMPLTRAANTTLDRVPARRAEMCEELAGWGETDLLCYRAEAPAALARRQRQGWDPLLDWAARQIGARLAVTAGVIPCRQPDRALAALRAQVAAQDDFALTALSEVVALSGSLVLGLATLDGHLAPDTAWQLSRIDEDWQVEHWGIDDAAAAATAEKRAAFLNAHRFHRLARSGG